MVPYVPAATFLAREKAKLASREGEPRRVALVVDAAGSMHGVTHTIERIRELGVPGFEVEVIGTDPRVDRRLPAVAEVDVPFYAGLEVGVPSVPELVETLAEGRYDLIHLASPGPAGIGAAICARIADMPLIGSYHTELAAYARAPHRRPGAGERHALALVAVLRPVRGGALAQPRRRPSRWSGSGSSRERIAPLGPRRRPRRSTTRRKRDPDAFPGEVKVLYAGRLTKEKGADLLAEAFLRARERDPRLHLLLAGGGPEEDRDAGGRERLGDPRDLPRLARPRGAGARLRERRHLPVLLPDRHLRPGDRRGAGERPAGRRRRPRGARPR